MLLVGSGMSDTHNHFNLPTLVVAGKPMGIQTARHLKFPKPTPWANMQLTLLEKVGVHVDEFGDSTSVLSI